MSYRRALGLSVIATAASLTSAQTYSLAQDLRGSTFFSGFRYNESAIDSNNFGNVHFLSQSAAVAANLTFIDSNEHAIVKVDNTTSGAGDSAFGRNSVYLISNNPLNIGSLLIFDAVNIPFGCSVWPSLFTQGANWPAQGEIDIVENVNLATINQYSLHVGESCSQPASVNQTGRTTSTNCTVVPSLDINTGCIVQETKSNSFGSGFAQNGGGVYAMEWTTAGISTWFFQRSSIPSDISATNDNPDPSTWGEASAFYPASSCDPTTVFGPQFITLYIDICGAFAGADSVFSATCGSVAPNCTSLVQDPANYANAYWEINYLRVFGNSTNSSSSSSGSSSSGSSGTGTGSASSPSGSSSAAFTVRAMKEMMLLPIVTVVLGLLALI